MGMDQAHEQNNKVAVAGPISSDIFNQSEQLNDYSHHENTKNFEENFRKGKKACVKVFLEFGNPFLENEKSVVHLFSKEILGENAITSVQEAERIVKTQMNIYIYD